MSLLAACGNNGKQLPWLRREANRSGDGTDVGLD